MQRFSAPTEFQVSLLRPSRLSTLFLILLATVLFIPQRNSAQVTPNSQPACRSGCGSSGGGGGGGGGTNYALTWTEDGQLTQFSMGGVPGRQGPAATVFNGQLYQAFTNTAYNGDKFSDAYVEVTNVNAANGGGPFTGVAPATGQLLSDANPALVTLPAGWTTNSLFPPSKEVLILATNSQQGSGGAAGGPITFVASSDGATWPLTSGVPSNYPRAIYSPALAFDGTYLYLAYTNAADNTLVLCTISPSLTTTTCHTYPGTTGMNFNPGMAFYNGTLYIAFEAQSNSHTLSLFTTTNQGQTITSSQALSGDQTSVAPSLVVHNSALYVGFRTNDNNQYFINRYSTDGVNFSADETISNPWGIGSTPALLDGNLLSPLGTQNYIYNYFGSNDGNAYLTTYYGH